MNVDTGEIKELSKNKKIDESNVLCPDSKKAQDVMRGWGKNKRERYAQLLKSDKLSRNLAFYHVEYDGGKPSTRPESWE